MRKGGRHRPRLGGGSAQGSGDWQPGRLREVWIIISCRLALWGTPVLPRLVATRRCPARAFPCHAAAVRPPLTFKAESGRIYNPLPFRGTPRHNQHNTLARVMGDHAGGWLGSTYLFVQAMSDKVLLPRLYKNPEQRPRVFKALKLAFADATGSFSGLEILKIHYSDPHLILLLKFCAEGNCRKFLQSYREGSLQDALQRHLRVSLASSIPITMELKAGPEKLDSMIQEEDLCLECISREKPNHLRDEEIAELEESLKNLNCQEINSVNSCSSINSSPSLNSSHSSLESSPSLEIPKSSLQDTFIFQNQQFANRRITPEDHQKFAKLVSKKWKQVGRSLCLQSGCRALRDHVIDNLAIEYEREGLYEQAYQLLRRFIDSEGKQATIQRLIVALEDNALISVAEELLGLHQSDRLC